MCIHPKSDTQISTSELNKITEEFNNKYNDIDSLSAFAGYCCYLDSEMTLPKKSEDLKAMHLNIHSVMTKQNDLSKLLNLNDIDVCTLNETWLSARTKQCFKIKGYTCYSSERISKKGGGVGIVVSNNHKHSRCLDLESKFKKFELCAIELVGGPKNIIIVSVYHSPNSNEKEFISDYSKLINLPKPESSKEIIIGMDHNFWLVKK